MGSAGMFTKDRHNSRKGRFVSGSVPKGSPDCSALELGQNSLVTGAGGECSYLTADREAGQNTRGGPGQERVPKDRPTLT